MREWPEREGGDGSLGCDTASCLKWIGSMRAVCGRYAGCWVCLFIQESTYSVKGASAPLRTRIRYKTPRCPPDRPNSPFVLPFSVF